jgi:triacylglycerol lipase
VRQRLANEPGKKTSTSDAYLGTSFGPRGINTTDQFLAYCRQGTGARALDNTTATDLAILYPDIPAIGIPATLQGRPSGSLGSQFKRTSALAGDLTMQAPRRIMSEAWARFNATSYSYLFNVVVSKVEPTRI